MGVETAYGKSVPLDAGVGNLAPFNTSRASAPLSMIQTGGMASLNQDVYDQSQINIDYNKLAGQPVLQHKMEEEKEEGENKMEVLFISVMNQ